MAPRLPVRDFDETLKQHHHSSLEEHIRSWGYDGLAVRRFSRLSTDDKTVVPVFLTHCAGPAGE